MKEKVLIINPPNLPFTDPALLIEPVDVLGLAPLWRRSGGKSRPVAGRRGTSRIIVNNGGSYYLNAVSVFG